MSRVVVWQPADLRAHIGEAMAVYAEAMDFPDRAGAREERTGIVLTHTSRAGFRARAALDDFGSVLGFGYGYTGTPGQWWHDQVARGLGTAATRQWLGHAFELCELHVRPHAQGAGLGRRLLVDLLDGAPERTVVLSTPEGGESRAWHLYRSLGFVDLIRNHRFPGDPRHFAILGRHLPLEPPVEQRTARARA